MATSKPEDLRPFRRVIAPVCPYRVDSSTRDHRTLSLALSGGFLHYCIIAAYIARAGGRAGGEAGVPFPA